MVRRANLGSDLSRFLRFLETRSARIFCAGMASFQAPRPWGWCHEAGGAGGKLAGDRIEKLLRLVGTLFLGGVLLTVPAFYGFFGLNGRASALRAEAAFLGQEVERIIHDRPELWEYETLRMQEISSRSARRAQKRSGRSEPLTDACWRKTGSGSPEPPGGGARSRLRAGGGPIRGRTFLPRSGREVRCGSPPCPGGGLPGLLAPAGPADAVRRCLARPAEQ